MLIFCLDEGKLVVAVALHELTILRTSIAK